MNDQFPTCAECPYSPARRVCIQKRGKGPENCPTLNQGSLLQNALSTLKNRNNFQFAKESSIQESQGYTNRDQGYANISPIKPRIQEIMEFAAKMDFNRLGLVFCTGLRNEAAIVDKIFNNNEFEVVSVSCKAGRALKKELDLDKGSQVDMTVSEETMCNPIYQAYLVNHFQTQFNVLLGLCVGHDSLFLQHANAYSTVLAVKDRLLGHNPLAAIYQYDAYYRYLKNPLFDEGK